MPKIISQEIEKTLRNVTWNEVDNLTKELANRLNKDDITVIIGIGRGGLVPAVILSHQLNVPLVPIMWQTRDGDYETNLSTIIKALHIGDTILVVDDISDSGTTLSRVVGMLYSISADLNKKLNITTAALFQKPESTFYVHDFGELVDSNSWQVFPWENDPS